MVRTVDAEQARTTAMLQRWVDQNSGTMNRAGVEAVRRMVEPEFQQLGFKTEWIDMRAAGRAGHLVAHHAGSRSGKRLLLIAHLDTVFEPDSPFQRWVANGNEARGPGAGDDKGGIAVIVAALHAMQSAGTLKQANVTVFLTGDEEAAGVGAGNYGAIYELARIIDQFRRELPEDKLTYNVGLIGGGQSAELDAGKIRLEATGKTNIIAATAVARGDLRAISQEQIDRTRAKMRAIVAQPLAGTHAEISFDEDSYPPMPPTAGNRALLTRLNGVNRDMGLPEMGELDPVKRAAYLIKINDLACNDHAVIPVVYRPRVQAVSSKLVLRSSGWDSDFWNLQDWYKEA